MQLPIFFNAALTTHGVVKNASEGNTLYFLYITDIMIFVGFGEKGPYDIAILVQKLKKHIFF